MQLELGRTISDTVGYILGYLWH